MNQLRSIREKKGLTLAQLAARASIPARVLAEYEEGRQPLPLNHAKLLAKALWVNIEDLLPPAGAAPAAAPSAPFTPATSTSVPAQAPRPVQRGQIQAAEQAAQAPVTPPAPASAAPDTPDAPATSAPAPASSPTPPPTRTSRGEVAGPAVGRGGPAPRRREADAARPRPDGEAHKAQPHVQAGATHAGAARQPRNPPHTLTEGQLQEILRLAARLGVGQEQLEQRLGKSLQSLLRPEAREWIKRLRDMVEELAPGPRIKFGHWPQSQEDQEAAYLKQQKEAGAPFTFRLFNGEQYDGVITDFTPYTITIRPLDAGEEVVLRKLAIAYYRRLPTPGGES